MFYEIAHLLPGILAGGTKILIAPFALMPEKSLGYTFWEAWVSIGIGGVLSSSIFYLFGRNLQLFYARMRSKINNNPQRKFTWQNRLIVRTRRRFGAIGIASLIGILSIPIGSLVMSLYTKDKMKALSSLWLSVIIWDTLLCLISVGVKTGLF